MNAIRQPAGTAQAHDQIHMKSKMPGVRGIAGVEHTSVDDQRSLRQQRDCNGENDHRHRRPPGVQSNNPVIRANPGRISSALEGGTVFQCSLTVSRGSDTINTDSGGRV